MRAGDLCLTLSPRKNGHPSDYEKAPAAPRPAGRLADSTSDGKFIQPNGKKFSLPMSTIGVWKDGVMVENTSTGTTNRT
jgi:hypothetical protein